MILRLSYELVPKFDAEFGGERLIYRLAKLRRVPTLAASLFLRIGWESTNLNPPSREFADTRNYFRSALI